MIINGKKTTNIYQEKKGKKKDKQRKYTQNQDNDCNNDTKIR